MTTMYGFPRRLVAAQRDAATPTYFHPSNYGTVSLWHRADNPAEGQVSQWNDLSGSGNHLAPIANSLSCAWHTTRDARRLRALVCPYGYMRSGAFPSSGAGAFTVVTVMNRLVQSSTPNPHVIWSYGTNTALQGAHLTLTNLNVFNLRTSSGTIVATSGTTISDEIPDVLITTYDGTTFRLYQNGSSVASASVTFNIGTGVSFTLGGSITGCDPVRARFYEVAAWGSAVDATQAAEINGLLQVQYRTGR